MGDSSPDSDMTQEELEQLRAEQSAQIAPEDLVSIGKLNGFTVESYAVADNAFELSRDQNSPLLDSVAKMAPGNLANTFGMQAAAPSSDISSLVLTPEEYKPS